MSDIILLLIVLGVTFITGSIIEKKHFENIIISFGAKKWTTNKKIKKIELVTGEVVISGDYFKNFVASLKNFFGGRLTPFESIMDRARREAILRMREKAQYANIIVNVRIESVMLSDLYNPQSIPQCAIIAYGTAVTYEKEQ